MKKVYLTASCLCFLLLSSALFATTQPATWATNFNLPSVNGEVKAIAETADAFFYGGAFTQVGNLAANNIVRVDKNTGAVTALGSATQNGTGGFLPTVNALAVIGTDLYVGGQFTKVSSSTQNAITANLVAKWSTTTNTWSPLGSATQNGTYGGVDALAVSGTNLYIGGHFSAMYSSTQNGITAYNIAKWDTVSATWEPLGSSTQNGVQSGSYVNALAVSGTILYAGGGFSTVSSSTQNAISAKFIAKWDISGNTWSPLGSATQNGTSTIVDTLSVNGTDLYVGGSFTTVSSSSQNAISAKRIAKWDSTGSVWSPLGSAAQNGTSGGVKALAVSGTDLFVGGLFSSVSSTSQNALSASCIAKWDTAAGTWSALGGGALNQTGLNTVEALAVSGAHLHAGGAFLSMEGITRTSGIAKWSLAGNTWMPALPAMPGDGIMGTVNAVVDAGNVVYVGGSFTHAGSVVANNVACWNKMTGTWSALGSAAQNGTNNYITALAMIGSDLYIGGVFSTVSSSTQNGISAKNIARWDTTGSTWSALGSTTQNGTNGFIGAMAVSGTDLYLGGGFTTTSSSTQNGISAKGIAKWDTAANLWSPLGSAAQNGVNAGVYALAISGANLYVGGNFTTVSSSSQNGLSANRIAKWDTAASAWSPLGSTEQNGTSGHVGAIAVSGTELYVSGGFITVSDSTQSGISAKRIAKWDTTGSTWSVLGSATQNGTNDVVNSLTLMGSDLYVGGEFSTVSSSAQNNISAKNIAKWSPAGNTWSPLGNATQNGANLTVNVLAVSETSLYAGGSFISVSSGSQNAINASRFGIYDISAPDITVEQPAGSGLADGTASIAFGSVDTGRSSTSLTFTVKNTGTADLTLGSISKGGTHPGEFIVNSSGMLTTVTPGASTTFTVTFAPVGGGIRNAEIHLASNLTDSKNPFDIALTGTGVPVAEIVVEEPSGSGLSDGVSALDFGQVNTGASVTKLVTVRNSGTADLTNLSLTLNGTNAADYHFTPLAVTSLMPGGSTTFVLSFEPSTSGMRLSTLNIGSNDIDENPFEIALTGTGYLAQPPFFVSQPASQLVLLGQTANLAATVTGLLPMTYQWKKGQSNITGATSDKLTIAVTKSTDVASYSVVADNSDGAPLPSQSAYLGLVTLSQGTQVLKAGGTLSLKCTATAPVAAGVSLSYLWKRSGDPLSEGVQTNLSVVTGSNKPALTITKIGSENSGTYTCLVTLNTPGNDPFITHGDTVVSVVGAVPVISAITPMTVSVSESIDFSIAASNSPTSFSLAGLPAGMKFDTKTGRLTGKPTTPSLKNAGGAYIPNKLTFKAMNPVGPSLPVDFYLTIEALNPTLVGTFNGVVNREGFSNFGMGGYVQITVANTGVVSGSATLAGQKHSVVGALDISVGNDPTAVLVIKRTPATLGDLKLTMNMVRGNDLMQGSITDPGFEFVTGNLDLGGPDRSGFLNGGMSDALFNGPRGIAMLANGDGFLADTGNHLIRKVANDTVSTFAGTATVAGESNGTGTAASFESPEGLAFDSLGNLYVADTGNATIRKITALGVVSTFAGTADQIGSINATGASARFNQPSALCFDPAGNLYVVDRGNHTIRKITPAGVVTTLAGKADTAGHKDGGGIAALFNMPGGIAYEPVTKALFVADTGNRVIRKVTLTGTVTTHAGSPGVEGDADGLLANARFINPTGMTTIGGGILIVGDKVLRQINPNGVVGTVSDYVDANGLDHPAALAFNQGDDVVLSVQDTLNGVSTHHPSGTGAEATFNARRNPWTAASSVAQMGNYTAGIKTTALAGDLSLPQGDGYATLTVSKTGTATWAGKTADGTGFTFATVMAADRHIPLHAMLYKNTGSLQGECFINGTTLDLVSDATTAFDWNKIPQPLSSTDRTYKGGFILHPLELFGGKYTPNHLYNFFNLTVSPTSLIMDFSETALSAFQVPFTIATPNVVGVPANPSSATLKIDPLTGIYTGSFKTGSPAVTASFTGVITNYVAGGARRGYGHFLLPESVSLTSPMTSGRVRLEK